MSLIGKGIRIIPKEGRTYHFIVHERAKWMAKLKELTSP